MLDRGHAPDKNARAWKKLFTRITPVVRVCHATVSMSPCSIRVCKFTWNRRGGMIGERFVKHSFKPAATSKTHPMVRSTIVSAEDPGCALVSSRKIGKGWHPYN